MVSCAFWVATGYRLAVSSARIVRVELKFIGDRSRILGTILPPENCAEMTKMLRKLPKIARKLRCFFRTFSAVILLKFLRVVDWGAWPHSIPPATPLQVDIGLGSFLTFYPVQSSVGIGIISVTGTDAGFQRGGLPRSSLQSAAGSVRAGRAGCVQSSAAWLSTTTATDLRQP